MKSIMTVKSILTLLLLFTALHTWGEESVVYNLVPQKGTISQYASNSDITISSITWNVTGYTALTPWRLGGKNITSTNREIYSKTPLSDDITKVTVSNGTATGITINSFKLVVSTAANGTGTITDIITGTFTANGQTTFTKPTGHNWANKYFKFVYTLTVSGTDNKYVEFKGASFYGNLTPTYTAKTLNLVAQNADGYWATFSNARVTFIETPATVYSVSINGNGLSMNELPTETAEISSDNVTGTYVPANTGVLIKCASTSVPYYTVTNKSVAALNNNNLVAGLGITPTDGSSYKYYKLAYSDSNCIPASLGFYWGAENGAPFTLSTGKAYLKVSKSAGAKSFTFSNTTTGIQNLSTLSKIEKTYNLFGQEVPADTKGIVIINGKKYYNK